MTDRTDLLLTPVPFAERTRSPLWESLTSRQTARPASRKLSDDAILAILREWETTTETQHQIGARYGVHGSTVSLIVNGKRHRAITRVPA